MIYLALPYTKAGCPENSALNRVAKGLRYAKAIDYAAKLFKKGEMVFCPVIHCHPIAINYNLPGDYEFWKAYNLYFLMYSRELHVLKLDGWADSVGVADEIKIANKYQIPVTFVEEYEINDNNS